jgi:nicotinamide-nucleotide amidase
VIAYANEAKRDRLGVAQALLDEHGAVSEAVARAMAAGVADAFGTDCGVGITGVAGPGGGSEDKPVGTVWIAWRTPGAAGDPVVTAALHRFSGDREAVRVRATQAALHGILTRAAPREQG